jgi:hypothetical protein
MGCDFAGAEEEAVTWQVRDLPHGPVTQLA